MHMKNVLRGFAAVALAVGFVSLPALGATDGTWNWSSSATPDGKLPENQAVWSDTANWVGETLPAGSTATAFLVPKDQATSLSGQTRYIRVPEAGVDIGEINLRKSATVYVTGGPIRFGTASSQSSSCPRIRDEGTSCAAYYYSLLDFTKKGTTFNKAQFCGPLLWPSSSTLAHSNYINFNANAWATNTLTAVTNPFPEAVYSTGSGNMTFMARMGAAAQTCAWQTFKDSPVLRRVGAQHDLAAGAAVSGDNIPPGAYVTRIYSSNAIEISAPCTGDSGTDGVTVTFGAFGPVKTVQHMKQIQNQSSDCAGGNSWQPFSFTLIRPEDSFDIYLDNIANCVTLTRDEGNRSRAFTASGSYTAQQPNIFLKSASAANGIIGHATTAFCVRSVRLVFSPENATSFPVKDILLGNISVAADAYYYPVLESPEGVTTTIDNVRHWNYFVTTQGAGTFDMTTTNKHHHALIVKEGTTVLRATRDDADFTTLAVTNGATLHLAEGAVSASASALQAGARVIVDAGTTLTLSGVTTLKDVTFEGDGSVSLPNLTACDNVSFNVKGTVSIPALASCANMTIGFPGTVSLPKLTTCSNVIFTNATLTELPLLATCTDVTFTGPGTYAVSSADAVGGSTLAGLPMFRFGTYGTARNVTVDEVVVPEVVGHPAFWVDAAKNLTMSEFLWTNNAGTVSTVKNGVYCWGDCRDGETTYYATNDWSGLTKDTSCRRIPGRMGEWNGKRGVNFEGLNYPGQSNGRNCWCGMVWNQPITNVCAVFSVYRSTSGGQAALGCTQRFAAMGTARYANDFMRGVTGNQGGGIGTWNNHILNNEAAECVRNGWVYVNGEAADYTKSVKDTTFTVIELHPLAPYGRADAFAIQEHGGVTCSGCQVLFETIVYTNELTMSQRRQVCAYLMEKYLGVQPKCDIAENRFTGSADMNGLAESASFGLDVPAGGVAGVTELDEKTFVKDGAGTAYVDYVSGGSLDVRGGTLEVQSRELTDAVIPAGYFVHLDANDTNRMTLVDKTYPDAVTRKMVRNWRPKSTGDAVGAQLRTTDGRYYAPWLAYPAALGGKPVVDFGELHDGTTDFQGCFMDYVAKESADGASMSYTNALTFGSVFVLVGSANGGGLPFSSYDYNPWRAVTSDPSVAFFNAASPACLRNGSGWINGEKADLTTTGLNGGYQVVSAWAATAGKTTDEHGVRSMNAASGRKYMGGGEIGEILIYPTVIDYYTHQIVDRYLNWKWLGIGFAGYRPSTAAAVTVAEGATLKVSGGSPLTAASLSGSGTVDGALALAADAVLTVTVNDDGTIDPLAVSGAIDLSKGGTIVLAGNVRALKRGTQSVLTAAAVTSGGTWTVTTPTSRSVTPVFTATGLSLKVSTPGLSVILR